MPADVTLPAQIVLYITGAAAVTNILVNGIRTAMVVPPLAGFLGACIIGFFFVVLFAIANGVTMTGPLWASSVIAGVLVGGASAGANAVHSKTLPAVPAAPPMTDEEMAAKIGTAVALAIEAQREARVMARLQEVSSVPTPVPAPPPAPPAESNFATPLGR